MAATRDFADFYRSAFDSVLAATRAFCGDADVAYESTQEAFARAYASWHRLADHESLRGWVTTSAFNLCRRHFRHRRRVTPSPISVAGPTSDRLELLGALRGLPERQRQAIVLHYLLDCPIAAVADLMGLSEGTVKAHLFKARAALRDSMEVRHV